MLLNKMPPIKPGQTITEYICSAPEGKDRVIKVDGYVIFVPTDKVVNETITVEILRVFPKFAFAVEINKEVEKELNVSNKSY